MKLRGKVREMRAADVFFSKLAHFEYISRLEKGEGKMDKRQRRDFESGKLAEQTLQAAQDVWLADKNFTSTDVVRLAKAEQQFGRLVAAASAALTGIMGIGTAIANGTAMAPFPIAMGSATVFFMTFVYPWRKVGFRKVEKTLDTIAKASARAQGGVKPPL